MDSIEKYFEGYKTYIVSGVGIIVLLLAMYTNLLTQTQVQEAIGIIISFIAICLRSGMKTETKNTASQIADMMASQSPTMTNDEIKSLLKSALGEAIEKAFPSGDTTQTKTSSPTTSVNG